MSKEKVSSEKIKGDPNCNLCQGTGIAKYFDMSRAPEVGEGKFTLGYLCEHFGGKDICPECFPFPSNQGNDDLYKN